METLAMMMFKPLQINMDMYVIMGEYVEETVDAHIIKNAVSPILSDDYDISFSNYIIPHRFIDAGSDSPVTLTVPKEMLMYMAKFDKYSTHPICEAYNEYVAVILENTDSEDESASQQPDPSESEQQ